MRARLSEKDIAATITGGYIHIILPDTASETGFTSYRVKLEDYISWEQLAGDITDNADMQQLILDIAGKQDALGFTPENIANKVTSFQVTPTNTAYPSEKLVKDSLDAKLAAVSVTKPLTGNGTPSSPLVYDNVVLKYVVPADTIADINITTDKNGNPLNFVDGDSFEIIIQVKAFSAGTTVTNGLGIRINGLSSVYVRETQISAAIYPISSVQKSINSIIRITVVGDEIVYIVDNSYITPTDTYAAITYRGHTIGANITAINLLNVGVLSTLSKLPAGAIILIKRV